MLFWVIALSRWLMPVSINDSRPLAEELLPDC